MRKNVFLAVMLLVCMAMLPMGCISPPTNTVYMQDAAGQVTGLAYDRNKDGLPDMILETKVVLDPVTSQPVIDAATGEPKLELVLDADGKPILKVDVVSGSGIYKAGEVTDSVAPTVLTGIGAFIPGGIGAVLIGLAAAWRMSRFGRIISNTVMSIQIARQRLKDNPGMAEALKLLDESLENGQLQMTIDEIAKIKDKMGLPSVTTPAVATP